MSKITYLAIPYTFNPEKSFKIANEIAAKMMSEGKVVFSPVTHSHPISLILGDEIMIDHDFWMKQDSELLKKCDEMLLVRIGKNGSQLIKESRGCMAEIKIATENNIPIRVYKYE